MSSTTNFPCNHLPDNAIRISPVKTLGQIIEFKNFYKIFTVLLQGLIHSITRYFLQHTVIHLIYFVTEQLDVIFIMAG